MGTKKMICLMIRLKKNDKVKGKRTVQVILEMLQNHEISGATVWTGIGGFGKRGKSTLEIEGLSVNMPLLIEVIEEKEKLDSILLNLKKIIANNGFVTLHNVDVL